MKSKILLLIAVVFLQQLAFAQVNTFSKRYPYPNNGSNFYSSKELNNNFYSVGWLLNYSNFTDRGYFVKTDKNGNEIFKTYLQEGDSLSTTLLFKQIVAKDDYLYASGIVILNDTSYQRGYSRDPILVKYDTLGNVIWYRKDYRAPLRHYFYSNSLTIVGNQLINVGDNIKENTQGQTIGQNIYIFWMDTFGNVMQQKELDFSISDKFETARNFQPLDDGGFLLTGQLSNNGNGSQRNGFMARMDSAGNTIWFKSYGDVGRLDDLYSASKLEDGNYLASGWRARDEDLIGVNSAWDAWLVKVNPLNGDTIWTKTVNAAYANYFLKTFEQSNGDLIIGGGGGNADSANADAQIMRLDSLGNKIWVKRYGWPFDKITYDVSRENIYDFIQTSDGGYMIVGDGRGYNTPTPQQSGWLLKLDSNGCLVAGCGSVGMVEFEVFKALTFTAYPNPAQNEVSISGELQDGDVITFFDFTGKLLEQRSINSSELPTFDVSNYANGIYLLQLYRSGYNKTMQKLMIAR